MTRWFIYEWGKPNGKNPTGWFSGHHSRNSTIITTSGYKYGIPSTLLTYSWTLTPIPNQTCFVVTVPLFDARLPSTWLTNCTDPSMRLQSPTKKIVGYKVLQFIHTMKIKKAWSQNPTAQIHSNFFKRKRWTRARTSSPVTICLNKVCTKFVQLVYSCSSFNEFALSVCFLGQTWRFQYLILKRGFLKYLNTS